MPNKELQILLNGEFYKTITYISGIEIKLLEAKEHCYARTFKRFASDGWLDVMIHIEALQGTEWCLQVNWDNTPLFEKKGVIGPHGYTELKELIKVE